MMDRREALLLIERLKRRTRDPDVLALCEYVEGERVNAAPFRRPGDAVNAPTVNAPKPATARSDMAAYMRKRRAALKALRGK
jgi:hypothetical protein